MIKLNSKESSDRMESTKLTTSKCGGSNLLLNKKEIIINISNKQNEILNFRIFFCFFLSARGKNL